jgi:hypothetical protein
LIRDGVLLAIEDEEPATIHATVRAWGCDAESVIAAFDAEDGGLSTSH